MSVKPRTIDNLGLEPSVRYAKDKEQLDLHLIEDSKWVSRHIEVSATKPYVPSEFDKLFSAKPTIQWALFSSPPATDAQMRALFSYQLIPSLGSSEKQEAETEKLTALKDTLEKEKRQGKDQGKDQQEENQRKRLLAFFKCLEKLDKTLLFINSRRNQYQRG
jgi:hypothetical protein